MFFVFIIIFVINFNYSNHIFAGQSNILVESRNEVDPLFGIETELRDPFSRLWYYGLNPMTLSILNLTFGVSDLSEVTLLSTLSYMSLIWISTSSIGQLGSIPFLPLLSITRSLQNKFNFLPDGVQHKGLTTTNEKTDFWVKYSTDFWVIEMKSKPSTAETYEREKILLDNTMFNPLANLGLSPAITFSSGHIHIDRDSTFGSDPQLLRDFVVDLLNNPGLLTGPLTNDQWTSINPQKYLKKISKVINDFDIGLFKTTDEFVDALRLSGLNRGGLGGSAISISDRYPTIELRFLRSQQSSIELILLLKLFKARLNYLKKNPNVPLDLNLSKWQNPSTTYLQVRRYVEGAGQPWKDYQKLLPRRWRWIVEPLTLSCLNRLNKKK